MTPNPKYLSASKLRITKAERQALIETRDDLASGRVKFHSISRYEMTHSFMVEPNLGASLFSMHNWAMNAECGTCQCIGGFMCARGAFTLQEAQEHEFSRVLYPLLVPDDYHNRAWSATPDDAVEAIDYFLSGGKDDPWLHVFPMPHMTTAHTVDLETRST